MPKRTTSYHDRLLEDLRNPSEASLYLSAALHESSEMFLVALRDVAEARQTSKAKIAEDAGVQRESVYRMLSASGNPTLSTLEGILKALDLELMIVPRSS